MTTTTPTLRHVTRPASGLLFVAAAAWVGVIVVARGMGDMPGAMGLGFGAFAALWALMMTAMMLPTIAPFAGLFTRTFTERRASRIAQLAIGYLVIWTLGAVPVYALAWGAELLIERRPASATALGVAFFAAAGFYQLTPIKDRCLGRCRSPLGFLLKYANYGGRWRDVRVGMSNGAFCLACCWALMAVLVAVGLMNVVAMVVLAGVVLVEKTWATGQIFSRVIGVVALALAVAVLFRPSLAAGLQPAPDMSSDTMTTGTK